MWQISVEHYNGTIEHFYSATLTAAERVIMAKLNRETTASVLVKWVESPEEDD